MKIYEINQLLFKQYGEVVTMHSLRSDTARVQHLVCLESNKSKELNSYRLPIVITPVSGVGVIFIEEEDGSYKGFLLDKTIKIYGGVWFCIVPYQCQFCYDLMAESEKYIKPSECVLTATGFHQNLRVDNIYTVLYQEKTHHFHFKGERHPYWELTYMDRGMMICEIEGKEYLLKQGDLIFFTPNQFHVQRAANSNPLAFVTVSFSFDFTDEMILRDKIIMADSSIQREIKQLLVEYQMDLPYSEESMIAHLVQMIITCIRMNAEAVRTSAIRRELTNKITNDIMIKCISYINENLANNLSQEVLARKLAISTSYLSKLFQKELGDRKTSCRERVYVLV